MQPRTGDGQNTEYTRENKPTFVCKVTAFHKFPLKTLSISNNQYRAIGHAMASLITFLVEKLNITSKNQKLEFVASADILEQQLSKKIRKLCVQ